MNIDDLIDEARSILYDKYNADSADGRQLFTNDELAIYFKRGTQWITSKTDYNKYSEYLTVAGVAITDISQASNAVITVPSANITQFEKGSSIRLVSMGGDYADYENYVYTILSVDSSSYTVTISLDSTDLTFTTGYFVPSIFLLSDFSDQDLHSITSVVWLDDSLRGTYPCQKVSWSWNVDRGCNSGSGYDSALLGYYYRKRKFYFQTSPKVGAIIQVEGRWSVTWPTDIEEAFPIADTDAEFVTVWWAVAMGFLRYKFNDQYVAAIQNHTELFNALKIKYQIIAKDNSIRAKTNKPMR